MRVVLLPLAIAALALGCTPDMTPEAAREAATQAAASGDGFRAVRFLKAAGASGDLDALRSVAEAYEFGYLPSHAIRGDEDYTNLPILALPGQAGRWRARYARERDALALSGDPDGWARVADDLAPFTRDATAAERDSAAAIRQRLAAERHGPTLVYLAVNTREGWDNPVRQDSLLRLAEEAGYSNACHLRATFATRVSEGAEPDTTVAGLAAHIGRVEACGRPTGLEPGDEWGGERIVRSIKTGAARGDSAAVAHLDSLRLLGVFERHPRLAAVQPG